MCFAFVQDRIIKSGKRSSASHIYYIYYNIYPEMCPCNANNCLMTMSFVLACGDGQTI